MRLTLRVGEVLRSVVVPDYYVLIGAVPVLDQERGDSSTIGDELGSDVLSGQSVDRERIYTRGYGGVGAILTQRW